ncbi:hypothetical protein FFX45_06540 [Thermosynechococcus sp. CL-1]|uniref:hypothetical protein n=1 Tax=unclassified Thermosynechococcus TaxID=2622553 RepID=UPI00122DE102|nr:MULTISPECIES: hypothetical protein [unclassified Thermosynechococcus]QEQ01063.1 hypothetical protein FFX45_06540 [Thermosynechococcus sp. CL-1]WJI27864.1 hypothetical protein M0644_06625 [Thermosynechococcus sp. B1]
MEPTPDFVLPIPAADTPLSEEEFLQQVRQAWQVCERFDLQTEIWRGQILRAVRDRYRHQGDERGIGFQQWLQEHEISKRRADDLIQLADRADELLKERPLPPEAIARFSKRAFLETAAADPEVQALITQAAAAGDRITHREVRQLQAEWTALHSDLLPPVVRQKASDRTLAPRYIAPLVKELEKLPPQQQQELSQELASDPSVETVKEITATARQLSRYLEAALQIQALNAHPVDLEQVLIEAQRLEQLQTVADLLQQAAQLESTIARLYTTWQRLSHLSDRLYQASGASTPQLQALLEALDFLSGDMVQIELAGQIVKLHIFSESETNALDSPPEF